MPSLSQSVACFGDKNESRPHWMSSKSLSQRNVWIGYMDRLDKPFKNSASYSDLIKRFNNFETPFPPFKEGRCGQEKYAVCHGCYQTTQGGGRVLAVQELAVGKSHKVHVLPLHDGKDTLFCILGAVATRQKLVKYCFWKVDGEFDNEVMLLGATYTKQKFGIRAALRLATGSFSSPCQSPSKGSPLQGNTWISDGFVSSGDKILTEVFLDPTTAHSNNEEGNDSNNFGDLSRSMTRSLRSAQKKREEVTAFHQDSLQSEKGTTRDIHASKAPKKRSTQGKEKNKGIKRPRTVIHPPSDRMPPRKCGVNSETRATSKSPNSAQTGQLLPSEQTNNPDITNSSAGSNSHITSTQEANVEQTRVHLTQSWNPVELSEDQTRRIRFTWLVADEDGERRINLDLIDCHSLHDLFEQLAEEVQDDKPARDIFNNTRKWWMTFQTTVGGEKKMVNMSRGKEGAFNDLKEQIAKAPFWTERPTGGFMVELRPHQKS
ncbi:hypothetical protein AOQ84DRAFT_369674 [Glonium stellatum]|uniref:Uncharacterized protein n=1 Tax=Glonium stellatum TaxID=574774 RepID=A0A8E2ENF6_9PEZI|nr:hypothetical protein AOQ84DRAFT_369674 [Glonium stellatum]